MLLPDFSTDGLETPPREFLVYFPALTELDISGIQMKRVIWDIEPLTTLKNFRSFSFRPTLCLTAAEVRDSFDVRASSVRNLMHGNGFPGR